LPVRVDATPSQRAKLVAFSTAGPIPIYVLQEDASKGAGDQSRIWAPITDTCVFLLFSLPSEIR
jgi:hypothetical protein